MGESDLESNHVSAGTPCSACDVETGWLTVARTFQVGGPRPLTIEVSTRGCSACGFLNEEARVERAIAVESCQALVRTGVVNSQTFRLLRQVAQLSAVEAGRLLLLAPGTLSRWENGHRDCSQHAWALMALAAFDTLKVSPPPIRDLFVAIENPQPFKTVTITV